MKKLKIAGIYKIINKINNKYYLGSSIDIDHRFSTHISNLKRGKHDNDYLQKSFNKHGENNFIFEIIEVTENDIEIILGREQWYLDNWKPWERDIGYNINRIASGCTFPLSQHPRGEEIRMKLSEATKNWRNGLSEEEKQKRKDALKGEKNPNWRGGGIFCECGARIYKPSKCCCNCLDRTGENNAFYGKTHNEETKNKLKEKIKSQPRTKGKLSARIVIIDGREFKSLGEAVRVLGIAQSTISNRLKSENWTNYTYK